MRAEGICSLHAAAAWINALQFQMQAPKDEAPNRRVIWYPNSYLQGLMLSHVLTANRWMSLHAGWLPFSTQTTQPALSITVP